MIKLSKLQRDFLQDRLSIPDALGEVFDGEYTQTEVNESCDRLALYVFGEKLYLKDLRPIDQDILRDVIEGSTFIARIDRDFDDRTYRSRVIREVRKLVTELNAGGFPVDMAPRD